MFELPPGSQTSRATWEYIFGPQKHTKQTPFTSGGIHLDVYGRFFHPRKPPAIRIPNAILVKDSIHCREVSLSKRTIILEYEIRVCIKTRGLPLNNNKPTENMMN